MGLGSEGSPETTYVAVTKLGHGPPLWKGRGTQGRCSGSLSHLHRTLRVQRIGVLMGRHLCAGLTLELGDRGRSEEEAAHSPCLHMAGEGLCPRTGRRWHRAGPHLGRVVQVE